MAFRLNTVLRIGASVLSLAFGASLIHAADTNSAHETDAAIHAFAQHMASTHGFNAARLVKILTRPANEKILKAIRPAATAEQQSWQRYRQRFIRSDRLSHGLRFWSKHARTLSRAEKTYGVPAAIIVAIIGIETEYGRNTGGFLTVDALTTLGFHYPPRASFFRRELEEFLLYARDRGIAPTKIKGSYAGAIGLPQFMPSSIRRHAVDFNRDGHIDLHSSTADAIGSVAAFLAGHGWEQGGPIAAPARLTGTPPDNWVAAGIKPSLQRAALGSAAPDGIAERSVALLTLRSPETTDEHWWGYNNFYVITRYNRSVSYAMAVTLLAEALTQGRSS